MIDTANLPSLIGATVVDSEGEKIGTVGQIYVNSETNEPLWASVRTGLFGMSESFVPLQGADADADTVRVSYQKDFVKDAPRIDADGALSEDEEATLYDYYSIDGGTTSTGRDTSVGDDVVFDQDAVGTENYDTATTEYEATTEYGTAAGTAGTVGYDTSGPTTDDAMTRSEEQLRVGTERVQTGRARLRKYVVTENETVTVPVSREEVRIEREPITDANVDSATSGPEISEEEHEVILTEERPVVEKITTPVERVRLDTETVTEDAQVSEELRKERIELEDDGTTTRG
jgi:uncharacterized protein (TIGR02271 family)